MEPDGESTFTVRGAHPRPVPTGGKAQRSGRQTLALAAVMVGWLLVTMVLGTAGGARGQQHVQPVTINRGVVVTPASGWSPSTDIWNVGPGGLSLKRLGVEVAFVADAYAGGVEALLERELEQFKAEFSTLRTLPPTRADVGGGLPAVRAGFFGITGRGQVEGEMIAIAHHGTGVIVVAIAPSGQMRSVRGDLDEMLRTLVIP